MKQTIRTTPFHTGNYAQPPTSEPVTKYANRSKMKGPGSDALMAALSPKKATLPKDNMKWNPSKTPQPRGVLYNPEGAFGRMSRTGQGQGVYSYGPNMKSAKSSNAIGNHPNRKGSQTL